jgi:soluble lytic murein transglycosylase
VSIRSRLLLPFLVVLCAASTAAQAQQALSSADNAIYRAAFAAAYGDRWSDVRLNANQADDPTLAKVLRWMELKDADRANDYNAIAQFLIQNPGWPSQSTLRQRAEEALTAAVPNQDVVAYFELFEPTTDDGLLRYIGALIGVGRNDEARALIADSWRNWDFELSGETAFLQLYGSQLNADLNWERIDRLIWEGKTTAAQRILASIQGDRGALARARILLRTGANGVDAAIAAVPAQLQNDDGLLYERMRWRSTRGDASGTLELLLLAPDSLSHPDLWADERLKIAKLFIDKDEFAAAYRVLADHYDMSGALNHEVDWLAGWLALRKLNEPAAALDHFMTFYGEVSFPISRARGAYWAGRAAEVMGDPSLAAVWYDIAAQNGTTFYGQLGAAKIGIMPRLPEAPPITAADMQAFADDELTTIVRQLHEIGEENLVRLFMLAMIDNTTSSAQHELIGQLTLVMGRPDLAVVVAKRAVRNGTVLVTAGYPVLDLPAGSTVDPALALAIIRQESAFIQDAVSPAGARGLMQLMLPTAEEMAANLGVSTSASKLLNDPEHNMRLGMAYIQEMLETQNGSFVRAIASYNAGPGRVRQWVGEMGDPHAPGIDIVDWIEEIPFSETQNYVQRVLEGMQVYRMLAGAQLSDMQLDPKTACQSPC